MVFDEPVEESPFICNVGDPNLVTVKKIPNCIDAHALSTVHSFESNFLNIFNYIIESLRKLIFYKIFIKITNLVDATAAGSGNLEIIINGGRIACRVWELAPRQFKAQFTPTQPIKHVIEMKFNGEHVLHSPWHLPFRPLSVLSPSVDSLENSSKAIKNER